MTTPSNPWGDQRSRLSRQLQLRGQLLGRRRARWLSRRFARVGVETSPERLQEILAGVPASASEVTDINFALIAIQIDRDERAAKFKRLQRRGLRVLIFGGLVLVVLNFLFCVAYVLLNLTQQAPPL